MCARLGIPFIFLAPSELYKCTQAVFSFFFFFFSLLLLVTFTHNSVIFAPRSIKFCVVVNIEVTKKFNFFFKHFFFNFFWEIKKNLKRYFYDGAHCQLMEINVRLWSSQSGNVAQSQLMELKVS